MFYTVFSTNLSSKMQWQSDLLEYSWNRVGQDGVLIRLVATDDPDNLPPQKHAHCVATKLWDIHPDTGDAYPVYNKPASLLEWVYRDKPEGTVLLLDPDCVFRAPVTRRVAPGFPASQDWIDFKIGEHSVQSPFGLGKRFSFLNDHCARTDLSIAPVMIPTLIHTRDLRTIGARWLELCGVIRENYRNDEGRPMWESDMFAYLAVCSEYGLKHQPIPLGICTNWEPADVPDAPIIHYCQPIIGKDGSKMFNKHTYKPWSRVGTTVEPERDYGRDLVTLINQYVDNLEGTISPPPVYSRPVWREGIMEGRVLDELLLERPKDGASLWLNGSGKAIWDLCNGSHNIDGIAAQLSTQFAVERLAVLPDVLSVVSRLHAIEFLDLK